MNLTALAQRLETLGRQVNRRIEWLYALLVAAMIVVWLGVGARYLTEAGLSWTEELSRYLMIWAALLAVSCAAWWHEHVGLDILSSRLPEGRRRVLKVVIDALCVGFFVFMCVYGIVTPTEAASIAVAYALFVGFVIYRTLNVRQVGVMLIRTARITGAVFLIIAAASILSWWLTFHQIPQMLAQSMLSIASSKEGVTALILALLLFVGMFLDITAALIILAPVLGPLTAAVGIDPVHAGIMIILALNLSLMTPPVGACLFVLCSVTGERLERIARALTPFLIAEVAILFLIAFWSDLTMFAPRLFGYAN